MTVVLGIDVGGTKLRAQLVQADTIIDVELPSRSWVALDVEAITGQMRMLLERLPETPETICVGASGCETPADAQRIHTGLQPLWPRAHIMVVNDAELVLPAAGLHVGTAIVSGTGAIGVATQHTGETRRAGGWGPLLGDDGSAFHLVRMAARHVLGLADLGQHPDKLTLTLQRAAGAPTAHDLMHQLHALEESAGLARFAPAVCAVAQAGDLIASRLVEDECGALTTIVRTVNQGLEDAPIVCAGGLIKHVPYFAETLWKQLETNFPQAVLSVLHAPPVHGAVRLAQQMYAGEPSTAAGQETAARTNTPHRSQAGDP